MKIAIVGASGRMGLSVARLAKAEGATIVGAAVSPRSPLIGRDIGDVAGIGTVGVALGGDLGSALLGADVVIDFSRPEALRSVLPLAARAGIAVVSGTTRLDDACEHALEEAAKTIPVLWAPNTSIGVQVLAEIAAYAAKHWDRASTSRSSRRTIAPRSTRPADGATTRVGDQRGAPGPPRSHRT